MTDEQIVKALECCGNMNECKKECPLDDLGGIDKCIHTLMLNALALIKRQQAEIEKLNVDLDAIRCAANSLKMHYDKAKSEAVWDIATEYEAYKEAVECALVETRSEAVREFAERLKSRIRKDIDEQGMFPLPYTKKAYDTVMIFINNLAKEMTEKEGGAE